MEVKEKVKEVEERLIKFEVYLKIVKEECIKVTSDASKFRKVFYYVF